VNDTDKYFFLYFVKAVTTRFTMSSRGLCVIQVEHVQQKLGHIILIAALLGCLNRTFH
jgi:hypothetical protein